MRRLIKIIEEAVGNKANIERHPEKPGEMPLTCADLSKAERLLGYHPEVPLVEGISDYIAWFRKQPQTVVS